MQPVEAPPSAGDRDRLRPGDAGPVPRRGRGRSRPGAASARLDLGPHDSGDGPAVFVIFILGVLVIPFVFLLERLAQPPLWAHMIVWTPVVIVGAIALLRPMKAILVALHYKNLRHEYDDPAER